MIQFLIEWSGSVVLSAEQIWPDGNGPKNPTAADVATAMLGIDDDALMVGEVDVYGPVDHAALALDSSWSIKRAS